MAKKFTGGCACGAIRYETEADPLLMLNCHCRHCQQASGGAFAATVVLPKTAVQLNGEPKYHRRVGDSGSAVDRGFCETCGSPIALLLERMPDLIALHAGSLDDPSTYKPAINIFATSAQAWDCMAPDLPAKPRGMQG